MRLILIAALLCASCAPSHSSAFVDSPTGPTMPTAGVATKIELNGQPGVAAEGGKATLVARVMDGFGRPVNGTVSFATSSGTITPSEVATAGGSASTVITAAPGSVRVTARMGDLLGETLVSIQPRVDVPAPTPAPTPQPPVPIPPTPDPAPLPLSVRVEASSEVVGTATTFFATAVNGRFPETYVWAFGDGGTVTSSTPQVTHLYGAAGSYSATATVTDALGRTASGSATATVAAIPAPPANTLSGGITCKPAPHGSVTACTLTNLMFGTMVIAGQSVVTANWDFGDGQGQTTQKTVAASNVYALAGTYPVSVVVDVEVAPGNVQNKRFVTTVLIP